jgi:SAM-dependent methyltransferase
VTIVQANPYDEVPYRSVCAVWSAPDRLALASLLHGGPRASRDRYRVLELGCGTAANLLPLAYYRPDATFVGLDGAAGALETAEARRAALGLRNVELVHADFLSAAERLSGSFDFILAHGVFSWVPDDQRDALLAICGRHLAPGGLVYLNYNARPGWTVRGMVRDFLRAQTAGVAGLRARAEAARQLAGSVAASFAAANEYAYAALMAGEFRLVADGEISYVAHEYLADDNHAYWRSELLSLVRAHGFEYVADADFNHAAGRPPVDLADRIAATPGLVGPAEDTVDFFCYRQFHSPILTRAPWTARPPAPEEIASLFVASPLVAATPAAPAPGIFRHPSGLEVTVTTQEMATALGRLQPIWPRGLRAGALFADVGAAEDDLRLLHRYELIDLRVVDPDGTPPAGPLNDLERQWGGEITTPYHTRLRA